MSWLLTYRGDYETSKWNGVEAVVGSIYLSSAQKKGLIWR